MSPLDMRIELLRHDDSRIQGYLVNGATNQWDEYASDRHGPISWLSRLNFETPSVNFTARKVNPVFNSSDLKEAKALLEVLS